MERKLDEEDEAIGAAQSVRGYHTLEYLLFKERAAPHCRWSKINMPLRHKT